MTNPTPTSGAADRCQACIDRNDGFYGSYAPKCHVHNDDGTPRATALTEAQQPALTAQAISAEPAGAWIERWHGSGGKEGHEGWSIVDTNNRSLVAYLGREVDPDAVTAIVMAHNALRASHGQAPAPTHEQIAAYLEATGAYVTNDATREAAIAEAIDTDRAKRLQAPDLHPKTSDLVQRFAAALAEKLAAAEKKYGYSDGWASPNWMDECRQHLSAHIAKGDPRDVAAYCAFLWHHGATTASPHAEQQAPTGPEIYVCARECSNCGHAGINDDHADNAACKSCDWSGPSPEKDHCPDCEKDGTMTAACPMCSCAYIMVADTQVAAPAAPPTPHAADTGAAQGAGITAGVSIPTPIPSLTGDAALAHEQCRAVVHLAFAVVEVYTANAAIVANDARLADQIGEASAHTMEWLADLLNSTDAVSEDDEWIDPIIEAAQERWPVAATPQPAPPADSVLYDPKAVLDVFNSARAGSEKPVGYLRGILAVIAHWESRPYPHHWMVPARADSEMEDAARLDWLLLRISGAEFRRLGVHYSGNARRADVDAARKQGDSNDL